MSHFQVMPLVAWAAVAFTKGECISQHLQKDFESQSTSLEVEMNPRSSCYQATRRCLDGWRCRIYRLAAPTPRENMLKSNVMDSRVHGVSGAQGWDGMVLAL